MPNYDVQIIDKHQHENNKHMLSYTNYFDKSGRKKRHKLAETVNNAQTREAARKLARVTFEHNSKQCISKNNVNIYNIREIN